MDSQFSGELRTAGKIQGRITVMFAGFSRKLIERESSGQRPRKRLFSCTYKVYNGKGRSQRRSTGNLYNKWRFLKKLLSALAS